MKFLPTLTISRICLALSAAPLAHAGIKAGDTDLGAIWCIGDSITQANYDGDDHSSPRVRLFDLLNASGYTFTFTGDQSRNQDGFPAEMKENFTWHSGYSGSMITNPAKQPNRVNMSAALTGDGESDQVKNMWNSGKLATSKPNLILIMLGTNDVDQIPSTKQTPEKIIADYQSYIKEIFKVAAAQKPTIIISTIAPNHRDAASPANTEKFNKLLISMVRSLQTQRYDIHIVNAFGPLDKFDKCYTHPDKLHVNGSGNIVIATQWLNKIRDLTTVRANSAITR